MDDYGKTTDEVRIEVSLTIDGDWRSDPLKLMSGLREGSRKLGPVAAQGDQGRPETGPELGRDRCSLWCQSTGRMGTVLVTLKRLR